MRARGGFLLLCLGLYCFGTGCLYQRYQTETERSATEQLLLTGSIRRAVAALEIPDVTGRDVAVETVSLTGDEAKFIRAEVEVRLRKAGARVVKPEEAELVYLALVDASGTASRELFFGVPSVPVGPGLASPSVPFARVIKQRGYTGLRLVAYDSVGAHVAETDSVLRRTYFEVYGFLFLTLRRNDIYPGEGLQLAID